MAKMTKKAAKQVIAKQQKVAIAIIKQMKAAEAAGDMQAAVAAADRLMDAVAKVELDNNFYIRGYHVADEEFTAMLLAIGSTPAEKRWGPNPEDAVKILRLPISDVVFRAYMAKRSGKK